jgi:hypothetical protein
MPISILSWNIMFTKKWWNWMTPDHTSGLRSPQMGPQLRPGTIPKTRYLWLPYTMRISCMFKNRIQGGQKMTFSAPSWLIFSKGMTGILYLTNHWIFPPHFSCNDIYWSNIFNYNFNDMIWCRKWSDLAHRCLKSRVHAAAD